VPLCAAGEKAYYCVISVGERVARLGAAAAWAERALRLEWAARIGWFRARRADARHCDDPRQRGNSTQSIASVSRSAPRKSRCRRSA